MGRPAIQAYDKMTEYIDVDHILKDYGPITISITDVGLEGVLGDLLRHGWSFSLRGNVRPHRFGVVCYPARLIMQHQESGVIAGYTSGALTIVPQVISTSSNRDYYEIINYDATIQRFESWLHGQTRIVMRYLAHNKELRKNKIRFIPEAVQAEPFQFTHDDIPVMMERIKELQVEATKKATANIQRRKRIKQGSNSAQFDIEDIKRRIGETENVS
jgi:hypothetical protein